ncbi:hypothetical protein NL676_036177 [Syzygium grande]|nr:hypothetical protein NL676_036177 [Syzygium grande]
MTWLLGKPPGPNSAEPQETRALVRHQHRSIRAKKPPRADPRETLKLVGTLWNSRANLPKIQCWNRVEAIPLREKSIGHGNRGGLWHRAGRRTHPAGDDDDPATEPVSHGGGFLGVGDHELHPCCRERSKNWRERDLRLNLKLARASDMEVEVRREGDDEIPVARRFRPSPELWKK